MWSVELNVKKKRKLQEEKLEKKGRANGKGKRNKKNKIPQCIKINKKERGCEQNIRNISRHDQV